MVGGQRFYQMLKKYTRRLILTRIFKFMVLWMKPDITIYRHLLAALINNKFFYVYRNGKGALFHSGKMSLRFVLVSMLQMYHQISPDQIMRRSLCFLQPACFFPVRRLRVRKQRHQGFGYSA